MTLWFIDPYAPFTTTFRGSAMHHTVHVEPIYTYSLQVSELTGINFISNTCELAAVCRVSKLSSECERVLSSSLFNST